MLIVVVVDHIIDRQMNLENPNFHSAIRPYKLSDLTKLFEKSELPIELFINDSLITNGLDYIKVRPQVNLNAGTSIRNGSSEFIADGIRYRKTGPCKRCICFCLCYWDEVW